MSGVWFLPPHPMAYWLLLLAQSAAISFRQPVNCVMPLAGGGSDLMSGYLKSSLYIYASLFGSERLVQNFYDIVSSTFWPFSPSGPSCILQLPWLSWALPSAGWEAFSEVLCSGHARSGPLTQFTLVLVCPVLRVYVFKYLPENLVGFSYRIWLPPQSSPRVSLILCWLWSLELLLCFLGIIVTVDFYQCQFIVESHHHHEVILRTKLQTLKTCIGQARGELGLLTSPTPERVSLRN